MAAVEKGAKRRETSSHRRTETEGRGTSEKSEREAIARAPVDGQRRQFDGPRLWPRGALFFRGKATRTGQRQPPQRASPTGDCQEPLNIASAV